MFYMLAGRNPTCVDVSSPVFSAVVTSTGGVGLALLEWTLHAVEGICHLCTCQERESPCSRNLKAECHVQVRKINKVLLAFSGYFSSEIRLFVLSDFIFHLSDSCSANAGEKLRITLSFVSQGKNKHASPPRAVFLLLLR